MFPGVIGGRIRLAEEIGRGGMGVVFRAEEDGRPGPIAVKFLSARRYSEAALRHFEQEFRTLATLSHPNLVEVFEFGRVTLEDGAVVPYYTMEFVEGERLDVDFGRFASDWGRLTDCLAQVGHALAYLHARGFVHRDIKPSNVLVRNGERHPVVKVMDLGLASPLGGSAEDAAVRGTLAYLAPESVRGGPPDPRSDLYSVGCMVYEVLTGRPPFPSGSPIEIVGAHLGEAPIPPIRLRRDVPAPLDRLVLRLLEKDPGARPPTAAHFLRELHLAAGREPIAEPPEIRRRRVLGAGFVGREAELERLDRLRVESKRGGSPLVLVVGPAGSGKSRLLRELEVRCQIAGDDVHVARPDGRDGSAAALGEALDRALRSRAPWDDPRAKAVSQALSRLLGREGPDERETDAPLAAELAEAVAALASARPLVLLLEDLHEADETTCATLRHLLRSAGPGAANRVPVFLVGSCRGEELARTTPLFDLVAEGREEGWVEEILLGPLGHEHAHALLRSMLGLESVPSAFVERVLEETRGNPLHIAEILAALAEDGLVEPGAPTPPDPEVLDRVALPGRVRDLLARRVARVGEETLPVLRAAAVLGRNVVDPDAVAAVTGLRWEAVSRRLSELSESGALERGEAADGTPVYRLVLPGLAEVVVEGTPEPEARALHERALSYLERRGIARRPDAWATLARHAERAGRIGRAVDAWRRAADLSRAAHALHDAAEFYGRAIEGALRQGEGSAAVLCSLYERRGEIRARTGEFANAEEDARRMASRAETTGSEPLRARAHLALGRAVAAGGDDSGARESLELAVVLAERCGDAALASEAAASLGTSLGRAGETAAASEAFSRAARHAGQAGRPDLHAAALLAESAIERENGNFKRALGCLRDADRLTRGKAAGGIEIAILEGTALAQEMQGLTREAAVSYERAFEWARRRGDAALAAKIALRLGAVLLRSGDVDAARGRLEDALARFRNLGLRDRIVDTLVALSETDRVAGRRAEARQASDEAIRIARRLGRKEPLAAALAGLARLALADGATDRAAAALEEALAAVLSLRNPALHAEILAESGERLRIDGRPSDARRLLQEAAFRAKQAGDRRLEAVALFRLGAAWLDDNDPDRAMVACRRGLQLVEGSGLPREEAFGFRLRARVELQRPGGDIVRASGDAEASRQLMEEVGDGEGTALAAFVAAKAAQRLGRREEAAERLDSARRWLETSRAALPPNDRAGFTRDPRRAEIEQEARRGPEVSTGRTGEHDPAGIGELEAAREELDALRRLLDLNRVFATTRDAETLLRSVVDAALALTGAERAFLLLADGAELETRSARDASGATLSGEDSELSRSVARAVLRDGRPLLSSDTAADETLAGAQSVLDLRIRSVLAVPLRTSEGIAGALYLDSRVDRGVLTRTHLDLATRLAEQAALALDTARLLERIEEQREDLARLNRELERTAEAQRAELAAAREELVSTRSSMELRLRFEGMVGGSSPMQRVYHLVERLAPKKLPVLVLGESGAGKELIARALHARSDRSGGPFFTVNCAALPENLLESELFGYRKGAFTGADRNKPGFFQLAHGGTLFLDEIGEMGPAMQAKLLRVLQEGEVLPIGASSPVPVDVRIVSATNRDLPAMVKEGTFREDLFYRIHVARIEVPPLRDRREDIPLLVDHFLEEIARAEGTEKRRMDPGALARLAEHPWPGNVRELHHLIHRLCAFAKGPVVSRAEIERYGDLSPAPRSAPPPPLSGPVESLEQAERRQILRALQESRGNKSRAAEILGINRATLFRKLRRYGMDA
jgi:transcriptional regulator with GAF, ATPase, and Fis domain